MFEGKGDVLGIALGSVYTVKLDWPTGTGGGLGAVVSVDGS